MANSNINDYGMILEETGDASTAKSSTVNYKIKAVVPRAGSDDYSYAWAGVSLDQTDEFGGEYYNEGIRMGLDTALEAGASHLGPHINIENNWTRPSNLNIKPWNLYMEGTTGGLYGRTVQLGLAGTNYDSNAVDLLHLTVFDPQYIKKPAIVLDAGSEKWTITGSGSGLEFTFSL